MTKEDAEVTAHVLRLLFAPGDVPPDVEEFLQFAVNAAIEGRIPDAATWSAFQAGMDFADEAYVSGYEKVLSPFEAHDRWKEKFDAKT